MKGLYGTTQYPPDTECKTCGERAVVVFKVMQDVGKHEYEAGFPLCGKHRDKFKERHPDDARYGEFVRFVDVS